MDTLHHAAKGKGGISCGKGVQLYMPVTLQLFVQFCCFKFCLEALNVYFSIAKEGRIDRSLGPPLLTGLI